MENEAIYSFIYKTVNAYRIYEEFIEQKLLSKRSENSMHEGYLIDKHYFDYWIKFSNYNEIKNKIRNLNYNDAKKIIFLYRIINKYQKYQPDALQYTFNTPDDLCYALKRKQMTFVLINPIFWRLICTDKGVYERGGTYYSLEENKIIFIFRQNEIFELITCDNIIDGNKIIPLNIYNYNSPNKNNNNYNNNNNNRNNNMPPKKPLKNSYTNNRRKEEEEELRKILLLYAFEQEMKNKINNLKYREKHFQMYYLVSKEWIAEYKKYYRFNEIKRMIQKREEIKNLLNNGYNEAKNNIEYVLKKISFNHNNMREFPENLKDNNTFLCERETIKLSNEKNISYWKNFEIINSDLIQYLSKSTLNKYDFNSISEGNCLISSGKVILDLSKDDYNENNIVYEIGVISNFDMLYNDEYLFDYDNEEAKNDNLHYFKNDFLNFQKENLNLSVDLECELLSKEGYAYGTAFKIPPHD